MPFTPLHMGLGLSIKAVRSEKVSLLMFGLSQVAIDLQPLIAILSHGAIELHGISHTILGATTIAILCLPFRRLLALTFKQEISSQAALAGAFIGVYSHLLLDSIVHSDVSENLFYPGHFESGLLGLLSWEGMNWFCLLLGVVGSLILWRRGEILNWIENYNHKEKIW